MIIYPTNLTLYRQILAKTAFISDLTIAEYHFELIDRLDLTNDAHKRVRKQGQIHEAKRKETLRAAVRSAAFKALPPL